MSLNAQRRRCSLAKTDLVAAVLLVASCAGGLALARHAVLLVDEIQTYPQIQVFQEGIWALHPQRSAAPGYPFLLAGMGWLAGRSSAAELRVLSFLFAVALLALAVDARRGVRSDDAWLRAAGLLLLPVIWPYAFLLYADVPSLLFVLAGVVAAERGRPTLAGLALAVAIAMRQNQIVWAAFVVTRDYVAVHGWVIRREYLRAHLRRWWLVALEAVSFAVFVMVNKGVAFGDRSAHPTGALSLDNVIFGLTLVAVLFLPLAWELRHALIGRLLRSPAAALACTVTVLVYAFGFSADHPYNQVGFYIHNQMLALMRLPVLWPVSAVLAAAGTLLVMVAGPRGAALHLWYPFSVAALLPMTMVEQRYAMVPLALFQLYRPPLARSVELALLALWAAIDGILLYGMWVYAYFP